MLGQVKVADKANEIVAIPKLLDMLAIEGAIVTIDAMGCQRAIARKVLDKKADYIFALKGNQGMLRSDVELFATSKKQMISKTLPSAVPARSMVITDVSKPGTSPLSMTSTGCRTAINGRASTAWSWSRAP